MQRKYLLGSDSFIRVILEELLHQIDGFRGGSSEDRLKRRCFDLFEWEITSEGRETLKEQ